MVRKTYPKVQLKHLNRIMGLLEGRYTYFSINQIAYEIGASKELTKIALGWLEKYNLIIKDNREKETRYILKK